MMVLNDRRARRETIIDGEGDGRDGRESPSKGIVEKASKGNRPAGRPEAVGRQGKFVEIVNIWFTPRGATIPTQVPWGI